MDSNRNVMEKSFDIKTHFVRYLWSYSYILFIFIIFYFFNEKNYKIKYLHILKEEPQ